MTDEVIQILPNDTMTQDITSTNNNENNIGARVFDLLNEKSMTQKELSKRTGILETTISNWKKNRQNPGSEKIMPLCKALGVTPYYLLEGKQKGVDFLVEAGSEDAFLLENYHSLSRDNKNRLLGYLDALRK